MSDLSTIYDETKANKRLPFDIDGVIETLMAPPYNLDLNNLAHTPVSVLVMLPKSEYVKMNIGSSISHKYQVDIICKETMLIIKDVNAG